VDQSAAEVHVSDERKHSEKMISAHYLGMPVEIYDLDHENRHYFAYCVKHDLRLQRCTSCKLFRYPPTTACPWCAELNSEWVSVEGRESSAGAVPWRYREHGVAWFANASHIRR